MEKRDLHRLDSTCPKAKDAISVALWGAGMVVFDTPAAGGQIARPARHLGDSGTPQLGLSATSS
jgi:hypothetical protein